MPKKVKVHRCFDNLDEFYSFMNTKQNAKQVCSPTQLDINMQANDLIKKNRLFIIIKYFSDSDANKLLCNCNRIILIDKQFKFIRSTVNMV